MPTGTPKRKKRGPKINQTDPKQSAKFVKAAKELGLNETSGEAFDRAMDALTKPKKAKSS